MNFPRILYMYLYTWRTTSFTYDTYLTPLQRIFRIRYHNLKRVRKSLNWALEAWPAGRQAAKRSNEMPFSTSLHSNYVTLELKEFISFFVAFIVLLTALSCADG